MLIGKVISKDNQLHVVTRVINDTVIANTEPLEEYISKNVMIKYNGEFRNLREIIELECNDYISKNKVTSI